MLKRSQGLPKQPLAPLAFFLTQVALELVPTSALSSTEALSSYRLQKSESTKREIHLGKRPVN